MIDKYNDLVKSFLKLKTGSEMLEFLKGILTPKELDQLSTRLEIVKMLKQGVIQQRISKKLGVGIATVTRGSRELKLGRFKKV